MDGVEIEIKGTKAGFALNEKDFKTGSKGFQAIGKMEVQGKRYQVNCMLVEIGSKPKST